MQLISKWVTKNLSSVGSSVIINTLDRPPRGPHILGSKLSFSFSQPHLHVTYLSDTTRIDMQYRYIISNQSQVLFLGCAGSVSFSLSLNVTNTRNIQFIVAVCCCGLFREIDKRRRFLCQLILISNHSRRQTVVVVVVDGGLVGQL